MMTLLYSYCRGAYGTTSVTSLEPIWLLGHKHMLISTEDENANIQGLDNFLEQFRSLFWMTYRKDFIKLDSKFTSDVGWGCMIRTAQMMIAQAFRIHYLGKDWHVSSSTPEQKLMYRKILEFFSEVPTSPYSVHHMARAGEKQGKSVGDWLGPNSVSLVLQDLAEQHARSFEESGGDIKPLKILVAQNGAVYKDQCLQAGFTPEGKWDGLVLLIPLRLGVEEKINPVYASAISHIFTLPTLGIIGGKPRASLYFVACQGSEVYYLDPHVVQSTVDLSQDETLEQASQTYHCNNPNHVSLNEIDPSMTIGFYFHDVDSLNKFFEDMKEQQKSAEFSLFCVDDESPDYVKASTIVASPKKVFNADDDDDDLVFL